jgi:hypothetical protein
VKTPDDLKAEYELVRRRREEARQSRQAEKAGADLEGPPEILTVNYEIQRLQGYHDRLLALVTIRGDRDQEAINAFTEGFLGHYRNLLDFLDSRGGDDDIKASDFAPEFKSTLSPEKYRKRINKRLTHLSRSRSQYPKEWEFRTMLEEIRGAWYEFVEALLSTAEEE